MKNIMSSLLLPPKQAGGTDETWTKARSVVIVGANGSGKSRMGVWIEQKNTSVHRVSAQRALSVPDLINPLPYEKAASYLHYGGYEPTWDEAIHNREKLG